MPWGELSGTGDRVAVFSVVTPSCGLVGEEGLESESFSATGEAAAGDLDDFAVVRDTALEVEVDGDDRDANFLLEESWEEFVREDLL